MAFPLQFLLETIVQSTLMPKGKKKHSKKDRVSADVLDLAYASLKKFRKVSREIGKLSTGQKLVGGLALTAAGLAYLALHDAGETPEKPAANLVPADEARPAKPRKPHKRPQASAEE
ncbi:hypothetical protein GCM10022409_49180 [Hymenobacter glaciei]|uniref:Uncharacterized protein n=1 Tax=Hymenobacter glaciei TaxID=877209 RepID=A0ABP7UZP9_9BACT